MTATVWHGDCLDALRNLPDASVDAIVTDPPYGLGFMGKGWDALPPGEDWARECLRVLKPGGHLLAFGGTRTWHRLATAIEDAGFELRDSIAWLYGSGFPKSLDVSKAIDKAAGAERPVVGRAKGAGSSDTASLGVFRPEYDETAPASETSAAWQGWGTALKPAFEPIVVARKPLVGTVAANVLAHGTGALNVDGCRIGTTDVLTGSGTPPLQYGGANSRPFHADAEPRGARQHEAGRWPANVVLDESQAEALDAQSGYMRDGVAVNRNRPADGSTYEASSYMIGGTRRADVGYGSGGGASRFFGVFSSTERTIAARAAADGSSYEAAAMALVDEDALTEAEVLADAETLPTFRYSAKAPTRERPKVDGVAHPTVKPLTLMRWLVRLVTPPGGLVLDPFAGSGTTVEAALLEGFDVLGVEREAEYLPLIDARIRRATEEPAA